MSHGSFKVPANWRELAANGGEKKERLNTTTREYIPQIFYTGK